jgi:polyribonucleotide nucleotidyltransferase
LEEEQKNKIEDLKKTMKENMVVKGTITKIQDFGAFVDIGGVQAFFPSRKSAEAESRISARYFRKARRLRRPSSNSTGRKSGLP